MTSDQFLREQNMLLEELEVYRLAMDIGDRVWTEVAGWDFFAKDTVGKQLVRAADSVAANISEGFGRYHYKENKHFNYYGRGSLFETKAWLSKAVKRNLISVENHKNFEQDINHLGRMLNAYIKSIGNNYQGVAENTPAWNPNPSPEARDPFSNEQ
jgi:four helix bundle protein